MLYRCQRAPPLRSVSVRCGIFASLVLLVLLCAHLVRPPSRFNSNNNLKQAQQRNKPKLFFDGATTKKKFKILQLADLHLGEDSFTEWGSDSDTFRVIRELIQVEAPDLIVLSGDQVTAKYIDANATAYYNLLADAMQDVPYAMIFGNHDDADYEGDTTTLKRRRPAKASRLQLVQTNQQYYNSLTRAGPKNVFGVSNYVLSVYDKKNSSNSNNNNNNNTSHDSVVVVKLQIILLDSGGGSLEQQVVQNQMDWLQSQRVQGVDAVAFQHIPTEEFNFSNETCRGWRGQSGTHSLRQDPVGEVSHLLQQDPRLHFLAVGHDHWNSYCCPTVGSLNVCYGRHSGYGGYSKQEWDKGARVFDITLAQDGTVNWSSWVRLESGDIVDRYTPPPPPQGRNKATEEENAE